MCDGSIDGHGAHSTEERSQKITLLATAIPAKIKTIIIIETYSRE